MARKEGHDDPGERATGGATDAIRGAVCETTTAGADDGRGGGILSIPSEKRKRWFNDHIDPSYRQLAIIHDGYTKQFAKALDLLGKGIKLEEVVLILKSERPNQLLQRQEVRENMIALRDYRLDKNRKPKVVLLFYDYVASVDDYLNAASPLPRETWYSYFISTFSDFAERGKDPMQCDYPGCAQGENAPKLAMEILSRATQEGMPKAFRKVQTNYAKLRAECLSDV